MTWEQRDSLKMKLFGALCAEKETRKFAETWFNARKRIYVVPFVNSDESITLVVSSRAPNQVSDPPCEMVEQVENAAIRVAERALGSEWFYAVKSAYWSNGRFFSRFKFERPTLANLHIVDGNK